VERAEKERKVAALHEAFEGAQLVVLTHQSGLSVAQSTDLRRRMRDAGARYHVTKNRLARIALKGTRFEHLSDTFVGPTAIAVSEDPVAAAKVAVDYAKGNDKLTIVGGALGEQTLDAAAVEALAKLPSLDELRARLVGVIQAPAGKVASVVQAPAAQLARVLDAYSRKDEAA